MSDLMLTAREPFTILNDDDVLLTIVEAARILRVDKNRIYHAINIGQLPMNVIGGAWMIRARDLSKVNTQPSRRDFVDLKLTVGSELRRG